MSVQSAQLRTVDTLQDLLLRLPIYGETLQVRGYDAVGDWGDARYVVHVPGSALATNIGNVFAVAAPGVGRWIFPDKDEPIQDIRWFGADSTGVTDSSPAINAALTFASAAAGDSRMARVRVPMGTFRVNSTLSIIKRVELAGVVVDLLPNESGIAAVNKGSVLKSYITNNTDVIRVGADGGSLAITGVQIRDLVIAGNGAERDGIRFDGADAGLSYVYRAEVERVRIDSVGGCGIKVGGDTIATSPQLNYSKFKDISVWAAELDAFHFASANETPVGNWLSDLYSGDAGRWSMALHGMGGVVVDRFVENNGSLLQAGGGMWLHNIRFGTFNNCVVEGAGRVDISGYSTTPVFSSYGVLLDGVYGSVFNNLSVSSISGDTVNASLIGLIHAKASVAAGGFGEVASENNIIHAHTRTYSYGVGPPATALVAGSLTAGTYRYRVVTKYDDGTSDWLAPVNSGRIVDVTVNGSQAVQLTLAASPDLGDSIAIDRWIYRTHVNEANVWYLLAAIGNNNPGAIAIDNLSDAFLVSVAPIIPDVWLGLSSFNNEFVKLDVATEPTIVIDPLATGNEFRKVFINSVDPNSQDPAISMYAAADVWRLNAPEFNFSDGSVRMNARVPDSIPAVFAVGPLTVQHDVDFQSTRIHGGADKVTYPYERTTNLDRRLALTMAIPTDVPTPFAGVVMDTTSAFNFVSIGGGSSSYYSSVLGGLYAGATPTTVTGTPVLAWSVNGVSVDPAGAFAGPSAGDSLHVVTGRARFDSTSYLNGAVTWTAASSGSDVSSGSTHRFVVRDPADNVLKPMSPSYALSHIGAAPASHTHTASQVTDFNSVGDARWGQLAVANSWSEENTFGKTLNLPAGNSLYPSLEWDDAAEASGSRIWTTEVRNSQMSWKTWNDSRTVGTTFIVATRTGLGTLNSLWLNATTLDFNASVIELAAATVRILGDTVAVQPWVTAGFQPLDSDLTAVAGLASAGLVSRTGAGTAAARTITGDSEIVVVNGDGVAGNPTLSIGAGIARDAEVAAAYQPLDSDLTAVAGLSSNGLVARTGSGTASVRTITGEANVVVTNGDGVSGNPTIKTAPLASASEVAVSNTTTQTQILSFVIPAGALANAGDGVEVTIEGEVTNNTASNQWVGVHAVVSGTNMFAAGVLGPSIITSVSPRAINIRAVFRRQAATTCRGTVWQHVGAAGSVGTFSFGAGNNNAAAGSVGWKGATADWSTAITCRIDVELSVASVLFSTTLCASARKL